MSARSSLLAELLVMTGALLIDHPDAPPLADISVNTTSLYGAVAEMQMRHADTAEAELAAVADWVDRLDARIRLRDLGSYIQLDINKAASTPSGRAVFFRVWLHLSPRHACLLLRAAKVALRDGEATLSPAQVRAAVARVRARAVAA